MKLQVPPLAVWLAVWLAREVGNLRYAVVLLVLCGACAAAPAGTPGVPPTVAAQFQAATTAPRQAAPVPSRAAAPAEGAASTAAPRPTQPSIIELAVYDGGQPVDARLNPAWNLDQSTRMAYDLNDVDHALGSIATLAVTPQEEYGALFFTVSKDAAETYPRDQVVGISLWLSPSEQPLALDDLAITVVGSNDYPYFVAEDYSAFGGQADTFSETRLRFLNINQPIPKGKAVEVIVWLDKLIYDPKDYKYVTGFYVKNDPAMQQTFYIDRASLLVLQ